MIAPKIRQYKQTPERIIQEAIKSFLRNLGWLVLETHGNMFMSGFPDLYATHRQYGARWIEVKQPTGYSFTPAQMDTFPQLSANGAGVWILVAATEEEYRKLWQPPNWAMYLLLMNQRSANIPRINKTFVAERITKTDGKTPIRSI